VALIWTAPVSDGGSPITNYKIYRGNTAGGESLLGSISNVLSYADTSVTNGQTYYYKVRAVNNVGEGPYSNEVSATPVSGAVLSAPRNLQATAGDGKVTLTWAVPGSDGGSTITNYMIYRGISPDSETLLATVGNVVMYTDTIVDNGQIYYYKVSAVNSVGEGAKSSEVYVTTPTSSSWLLPLLAIIIIIAVVGAVVLALMRKPKIPPPHLIRKPKTMKAPEEWVAPPNQQPPSNPPPPSGT